jgi:ABC-type uncharacterized transport system involved in gliding motility auxiliary subunit
VEVKGYSIMQFVFPKKWMNVIGLAGFGLLFITLVIYLATSVFGLYAKVILGLGVAGILVFWVLNIMTSKTTRYGSNVVITILLALAILVLINFVSAKHFKRLDTTQNKVFSLSEQTEKILKELTQDITVTGFYTENHYRRKSTQDVLNEYAEKSNKIKFTMIDPASKPGIASAYKITQDGTVVFDLGGKKENVVSYENEEQDFTSAILKLTSSKQKKVYFLSGHGERDIDGPEDDSYTVLKNRIQADNYGVEKLILAQQIAVPEDCNVLIIAGPQNPLLETEEEAIIDYLDLGGKAIIMADPSPSVSLENILKKWGVDSQNDIILDGLGRSMLGDPTVPVCLTYGNHPITTPLSKGLMTFFPIARSLAPIKDANKDINVTELVKTSNNSWGETNIQDLISKQTVEFNEGQDIKGPLTVAVAVAIKGTNKTDASSKERRVLVAFGDSDFAMNKYLQQGNPDLFMNSLNWLTEDENLISIRPKSQEEQSKIERLSGKEIRFVSYSSIFAIPLLLMLIGARVWWKRR